jgi:hypothetical protein
MIENLINLVKSNSQDLIVNNPAIPNQFNDAAVGDTATSIMEGIKTQAQAGNIGDIMGLLQGGQSNIASNPVVSSIISNLAGNFTSKYGVNTQQATGIASSLVPNVISQLAGKINDPNDSSFDLEGIISSISGGQGLGGLFGGNSGGGGGLGDTLGKLF